MPESDPARQCEVAAALRVVKRLVDGAVCEMPDGGSVQQQISFGCSDPFELVVEQFAEQVMEAIPIAFVVEGNHEQVDPVELVEEFVRPVLSEHRVAELGVEPSEQGDSDEERANLVGLL
jgi:hypothetical protein